MPLQHDPSGTRYIQVEAEVPGLQEEVWHAVASGPGISSWFVPTRVETDDGIPARIISDFGPWGESTATVTAWHPPRRFAAESADLGPGAPPVGTEWTVESVSDGACRVRVVQGVRAGRDEWDRQLEGWEQGWPGFFRTLRLSLEHFRGAGSASFQVAVAAGVDEAAAWDTLVSALGIAGLAPGERAVGPRDAPAFGGVVEEMGHAGEALVRVDRPAPGLASFFTMAEGSEVTLWLLFRLFGPDAASVAEVERPRWDAWARGLFPDPIVDR